jgi:uncharacterized protein YcbK (DUF882 family)
MKINWNDYDNFTSKELACVQTGECDMDPHFMRLVQDIRDVYDRPMTVASGFRSELHTSERFKMVKGEHTKGLAVDIKAHGSAALDLIYIALIQGVRRIGVHQLGNLDQRFVHLGIGYRDYNYFVPGIWTY